MQFRQAANTTLFLLITRLITRFLAAVTVIVIVNYAGAKQYGVYATATALIDFFLLFNDFGMPQLLVREGSRDPKRIAVHYGNTLLVESFVTVIVFTVMLATAHILNYPPAVIQIVLILGAANFIFEHRKVCRSIFRVLEKLKRVAVFELADAILTLSGIFVVAIFISKASEKIIGFAWIQLLINILLIFGFFIYSFKLVKPKFSLKEIFPMMKEAYAFSVATVFFAMYFQVDQLVISKIQTTTEVGLYTAPLKIVMIFLLLPTLVFQVIQPMMYKFFAEDKEKYKRIHFALLRYFSAVGIIAGIIMSFASLPIVQFLFRKFSAEEAAQSADVLKYFGYFLIFFFISTAAEYSLTTMDRLKLKAFLRVATVIINLVLDIIFVYKWGFIGAAYATLIVQIMMSVAFIYYDTKYLGEKIWAAYKQLIPAIIAGILVSMAILYMDNHLNVILNCSIALLLYVALLYILRFFTPYDFKLFKQLIPNKKNNEGSTP